MELFKFDKSGKFALNIPFETCRPYFLKQNSEIMPRKKIGYL